MLQTRKKIPPRKGKRIISLDEMQAVLDINDISLALRVSRANAYKISGSKGFPRLKVGKRVLVQKKDFIEWVDSQKEII